MPHKIWTFALSKAGAFPASSLLLAGPALAGDTARATKLCLTDRPRGRSMERGALAPL